MKLQHISRSRSTIKVEFDISVSKAGVKYNYVYVSVYVSDSNEIKGVALEKQMRNRLPKRIEHKMKRVSVAAAFFILSGARA